jgi:hypothetical protein
VPDHNGHLVGPTDDDRSIIKGMLEACTVMIGLYKKYIEWIERAHLFLESEVVNLNWILAHLLEVEKELNRLKERVQHEDISDQ